MSEFGYQILGFGGGRNPLYRSISLSSITTLTASTTHLATIAISATKMLCLYSPSGSDIYGFVINHDTNDITSTGSATLLTTIAGTFRSVCQVDANKAVLISSNDTVGTIASIISVSGDTISIGTGYQIYAVNRAGPSNVVALSTAKFLVALGTGARQNATTVLCSVSGTVVSVDDAEIDGSRAVTIPYMRTVSSNLAYVLGGAGSEFVFAPIQISGSAITMPSSWTTVASGFAPFTSEADSDIPLVQLDNETFLLAMEANVNTLLRIVKISGSTISSLGAQSSAVTGSYLSVEKISALQALVKYYESSELRLSIINVTDGTTLSEPYGSVTVSATAATAVNLIRMSSTKYLVIGAIDTAGVKYKIATIGLG